MYLYRCILAHVLVFICKIASGLINYFNKCWHSHTLLYCRHTMKGRMPGHLACFLAYLCTFVCSQTTVIVLTQTRPRGLPFVPDTNSPREPWGGFLCSWARARCHEAVGPRRWAINELLTASCLSSRLWLPLLVKHWFLNFILALKTSTARPCTLICKVCVWHRFKLSR